MSGRNRSGWASEPIRCSILINQCHRCRYNLVDGNPFHTCSTGSAPWRVPVFGARAARQVFVQYGYPRRPRRPFLFDTRSEERHDLGPQSIAKMHDARIPRNEPRSTGQYGSRLWQGQFSANTNRAGNAADDLFPFLLVRFPTDDDNSIAFLGQLHSHFMKSLAAPPPFNYGASRK